MTGHYHKCLLRCKELHKLGITDNANMSASVLANTADRIIYTYAIEMCQTAALDELFGDPKEVKWQLLFSVFSFFSALAK